MVNPTELETLNAPQLRELTRELVERLSEQQYENAETIASLKRELLFKRTRICRVASHNFATGCLTKDVTRHLTEEALNGLLPPYPHSLLQRIELSQAVPPRVTRLELDQ